MFEYPEHRYHPREGAVGDPDASKPGRPRKAGLPSAASQGQRRQGSTAGKSWDEEEHMQFLEGLNAFGKGQWKQISKYYVPSRTPTQVASHAQKHFLRVTGSAKRKSKFATVDAMAEMHFGAAVTRDGMSGTVRRMGGVKAAHPSSAAAAAGAAEVAGAARKGTPLAPRSTRGREASDSRGHATSEDTGSTRQAFTNGLNLYNANGHILSGKGVPPVQSDGIALGIPLQEIPDLKAYGGKDLPMLKVIKGRIRATSNLFRPPSPAPSQRKHSEDMENAESDGDMTRRKRVRKSVTLREEGFDSALVALANIAVGLADGHVYY